ncbi:MAG: 30S ribosomal protein S15 [Candidatus Dasytiphilus stammeri]
MSEFLPTKSEIIIKYGNLIKNTGCTEVQVALLSNRINLLRKHFDQQKKDHHSRRGLLRIISKRRSLLNYLKRKNIDRYTSLIEKLELRR